MNAVASSSRPVSSSSETSLHADFQPPSILRRTSENHALHEGVTLSPCPISRRRSRVRFSETEGLALTSTPVSLRRTASGLPDHGSRRASLHSSSSFRAPSPSDFTPRPLPMPKYNGPTIDTSLSIETPKRRKLRPRPPVDALKADLDTHRLSIPDLSRSLSSASSSSSTSRRSSARFSILSDPDDLDMLASIGGIPDFDDFFQDGLVTPSSSRRYSELALDEKDGSCTPPHLPLPIPCVTSSVLHTIPAALSPVCAEDDKTPVPTSVPVFDPNAMSPHTQPHVEIVTVRAVDHGRSSSFSSIAPLLVFPIPPSRNLALQAIEDRLARTSLLLDNDVQNDAGLAELPYQNESSFIEDESAPQVDALDDETHLKRGAIEEVDGSTTLDIVQFDDPVACEAEIQIDEPLSPILPNFAIPSSPFASSSDLNAGDADDDVLYHLSLHEAAVRSGVLSYQSRLIWPTKPKRRHYRHRASFSSPILPKADPTGWSGSESEEEEFNAVLSSIARRRLARKLSKHITNFTPPKDQEGRLSDQHRLSVLSQSSASSIEILTPNPHSTPSSCLFGSGSASDSYDHTSPTPAPRQWVTTRPSSGNELGLSLSLPLSRVHPAPRRQVKGWGKPELLLEDEDDISLVLPSSDDEILPSLVKGDDDWLMDETEPELEPESESGLGCKDFRPSSSPSTRHRGVPF